MTEARIRRRIFRMAWVLVALALGVSQLAAFAEDAQRQLEINAISRPQMLVEPGNVSVDFSIVNVSDEDVLNVSISTADGLISAPMGMLAPGSEQSFSREHSVTEAELDAGAISYIISHDAPDGSGTKVNYTVSAPIWRGTVKPELEFTRTLSSRQVERGESLSIGYSATNTGNVALTELTLRDSLGEYVAHVDRLEVGESRSFISHVVINESALSHASLSYSVEGSKDAPREIRLTSVQVELAEPSLAQRLTVREGSRQGTVQLLLELTNAGNTDFEDIVVSDTRSGAVLMQHPLLPAGAETLEMRKDVPARVDGVFELSISARSASGSLVTLQAEASQPISAEDESPARLSIVAEVEAPRIRRAGDVALTLHIRNEGGTLARNIMLSEAEMGDLRSFEFLPAKDEIIYTTDMHITQDSSFTFGVRYPSRSGATKSAVAEPVTVVFASDGVIPRGASNSLIEFSGHSLKIGGSSSFATLLLIGFALLIILTLLLMIASGRARRERRASEAAAKQRRREELGRTNRFKPVRTAQKKKKRARRERGQ